MSSSSGSRSTKRRHPGLLAFALFAAAGLWLLFVAGFHLDEWIVGILAIMGTMAFSISLWRSRSFHIALRARDLLQCWRIPWYVLSGLAQITWILLKDLLHISPAQSLFRVTRFEASNDPVRMSRRVLAVAYTTAAPNFIVLGIDGHSHRMLFHQIERGSFPKMTIELGAKV